MPGAGGFFEERCSLSRWKKMATRPMRLLNQAGAERRVLPRMHAAVENQTCDRKMTCLLHEGDGEKRGAQPRLSANDDQARSSSFAKKADSQPFDEIPSSGNPPISMALE